MSNETDLDWLARNVHVWPTSTPHIVPAGDSVFEFGVTFFENHACVYHREHTDSEVIHKKQWLSRRAELQNKPSWDASPEWAQFLGQDEDGVWYWHGEKPNEKGEDVNGRRYWMSRGISDIACRGELLGDWRDTLEKRPEQDDFVPFTSIEDNQEQEMTQQQEMKQDSGWFERGDLPPVGCLCLYVVSDRLSVEVEITAHAKLGLCFVGVGKSGESYVSKTGELHRFRPIRTERDDLIEIISSSLLVTTEQVADAIIAAGFKLEAK